MKKLVTSPTLVVAPVVLYRLHSALAGGLTPYFTASASNSSSSLGSPLGLSRSDVGARFFISPKCVGCRW